MCWRRLESDMAADLLGEFSDEQTAALLEEMEESDDVAPLLAYPEDTAGGIMNTLRHMLRRQMTAAQAMAFLSPQQLTFSALHSFWHWRLILSPGWIESAPRLGGGKSELYRRQPSDPPPFLSEWKWLLPGHSSVARPRQ